MMSLNAKIVFLAAVMASGRLVYFGESSQMCNYFQSIGFPSPSFKNPCDYYGKVETEMVVFASRPYKISIFPDPINFFGGRLTTLYFPVGSTSKSANIRSAKSDLKINLTDTC